MYQAYGLATTTLVCMVVFLVQAIAGAENLLVNDRVTFEPLESTFHTTTTSTRCPSGFSGTFSFDARLTNIRDRSLTDLIVEVVELTNENLLQNGEGGPGGVGAILIVPETDDFLDGGLAHQEFVDVPFVICLKEVEPFRFFVNVFGALAVFGECFSDFKCQVHLKFEDCFNCLKFRSPGHSWHRAPGITCVSGSEASCLARR